MNSSRKEKWRLIVNKKKKKSQNKEAIEVKERPVFFPPVFVIEIFFLKANDSTTIRRAFPQKKKIQLVAFKFVPAGGSLLAFTVLRWAGPSELCGFSTDPFSALPSNLLTNNQELTLNIPTETYELNQNRV